MKYKEIIELKPGTWIADDEDTYFIIDNDQKEETITTLQSYGKLNVRTAILFYSYVNQACELEKKTRDIKLAEKINNLYSHLNKLAWKGLDK